MDIIDARDDALNAWLEDPCEDTCWDLETANFDIIDDMVARRERCWLGQLYPTYRQQRLWLYHARPDHQAMAPMAWMIFISPTRDPCLDDLLAQATLAHSTIIGEPLYRAAQRLAEIEGCLAISFYPDLVLFGAPDDKWQQWGLKFLEDALSPTPDRLSAITDRHVYWAAHLAYDRYINSQTTSSWTKNAGRISAMEADFVTPVFDEWLHNNAEPRDVRLIMDRVYSLDGTWLYWPDTDRVVSIRRRES